MHAVGEARAASPEHTGHAEHAGHEMAAAVAELRGHEMIAGEAVRSETGSPKDVPTAEIVIGDLLFVRLGDEIGTDGAVGVLGRRARRADHNALAIPTVRTASRWSVGVLPPLCEAERPSGLRRRERPVREPDLPFGDLHVGSLVARELSRAESCDGGPG